MGVGVGAFESVVVEGKAAAVVGVKAAEERGE